MSHFWNCISGPIEQYSSNVFAKLGAWIYDKPLVFIVAGFFLSTLMGFGLINTTFSNDIIELYTPQETTSAYPDDIYNEYMTSKQLFGSSLGSTLTLILSLSKESNIQNILTTNTLNEAYDIWNTIHSINAVVTEANDVALNYKYTDLCEKQYPSSLDCVSATNNFFSMAFTNTTTNQIDPRLWQNKEDIDTAIDNGPDKLRLFIGGDGNSLLLSYSLTSYDYNSGSAKDIFIDNWILYWSKHKADYSSIFNIDYFSPTSFETETKRMLGNNIKLLIVSIFLLLIYMMFMYGKLSMVYSRSWLAFGGIISISLSIIAGFGTASAAGWPFTVYIFLLPFIVFGVGIDIMIFTVDTFNNIPLGDSDKHRFGKLLSEIGYLITISTLTTILAFSFGCVVQMTGVRTFCIFALCCFIWNYINFWLIILPVMVWDNKRIANNRNGVLCCMESNTSSKEEKRLPYIAQLLNYTIIKIINNKFGRYFILIIFLIFLILSSVSIPNTNTKSDPTNFLSDDSYLNSFYAIYNSDFNGFAITELDIIIQNVDFSDNQMRDNFNDLFIEIDNTTQIISNTNEWLSDFDLFVMDDLGISNGLNGLTDPELFYLTLKQWTNSSRNTNHNNINNINWGKEIIYDNPSQPTKISATRFFVLIFQPNNVNEQLEIRKEYMDILDTYNYGDEGEAFIFNLNWALIYFDFVVLNYTEAIMIFSGIGMFFILWVFIDWRVMFVMIINVIMINLNLFGWINLCNLILDSMTFIQCLMAIGFTIDYIMYITYIISKNQWQLTSSMDNYLLIIITSLCRSAFTTWIALLPLAFADTDGFIQFYIMFNGIIFIALGQSILFTVAFCIEMNLLFQYISAKINNNKSDISNLTATVNMSEIRTQKTHKQTRTPSVELGANVVDIDGDLNEPPKTRRKASSIDIYDVNPIIFEQKQEQPDTPDEQLGKLDQFGASTNDKTNVVKYKIKIEDVS